jgi:hypothetical protein
MLACHVPVGLLPIQRQTRQIDDSLLEFRRQALPILRLNHDRDRFAPLLLQPSIRSLILGRVPAYPRSSLGRTTYDSNSSNGGGSFWNSE